MADQDILKAVISMALSDMSNESLAALNNVIQWTGVVPKVNRGYSDALSAGLISEACYPTLDLNVTQASFAFEVNRRVAAGTFQ